MGKTLVTVEQKLQGLYEAIFVTEYTNGVYHTMIRGVLRPAFQMAEDDDLIRKKPFGFQKSSYTRKSPVAENKSDEVYHRKA